MQSPLLRDDTRGLEGMLCQIGAVH